MQKIIIFFNFQKIKQAPTSSKRPGKKLTVMQIEKALINNCLRVSKVS